MHLERNVQPLHEESPSYEFARKKLNEMVKIVRSLIETKQLGNFEGTYVVPGTFKISFKSSWPRSEDLSEVSTWLDEFVKIIKDPNEISRFKIEFRKVDGPKYAIKFV